MLYLGFKNRPDSQASTILSYLLFEKGLLPQEKIRLLTETSLSYLQERMQFILASFTNHIAYIHGNMKEDEALACYEAIVKQFYAPRETNPSPSQQQLKELPWGNEESVERIRELPVGSHLRVALPPFNPADPNNAYILYFQVS